MHPKTTATGRVLNGRHMKLSGKAPTPIFVMGYPGTAVGAPQSYVMDVLSDMLGTGSSSFLAQRYVHSARPRLASISAGNYNLTYNGVFYLWGKLLPWGQFWRGLCAGFGGI